MYQLTTDEQSRSQLDALPAEGRTALPEVWTFLQVAPWNGVPLHKAHPESPMRIVTFGPRGEGLLTYLVLEDVRRVDVLDVTWLS